MFRGLCSPGTDSEMEFNVGRFLEAALGINTYVKEGTEAQGAEGEVKP